MKVPFSVDLTGKTAIVTGGSGVLCSAMVYGLAVNGAKVAIIGRNKEKLAKMSETLTENAKNEYSKEATVKGYSCNVLDKEELVKTYEQIKAAYDKYYADEKFVRVLEKDQCPETKWVEGSNYVDIGFKIDERTGRIIMMGAIDNLVKGAAGQAIQNMNLLFGLPENTGLKQIPMFP